MIRGQAPQRHDALHRLECAPAADESLPTMSAIPAVVLNRLQALLLSLLLAACTQLAPLPDAGAPPAPLIVKLIAFNDFHGNLKTPSTRVPVPDATQPNGFRLDVAGGIEPFAALVNALRQSNPNHAVVTAGDLVGATPLLSALFRDEPTIEAMNLVGIDFHAVGNHEFDYGLMHLRRLQFGGCAGILQTGQPDCAGREPYKGANFPFLAANTVETATGKTIFPPYGIKEFEGIKVGFIGITLRGTAALVRPGGTSGLEFKDEVATANALVPELKKQGVATVVLLLHEGGEQGGGINDCKDFKGELKEMVARLDPAIEVIASAHTHRYYVCEFGNKLVTSAGSYGTLLTEIDLGFDRVTHKLISKHAQNRVVDPRGPKDAQLTALVDKYSTMAAPLENRVVGKVLAPLTQAATPDGESTLGNLIADAQLFATDAPDKGGAVLALNNPGSLRAPILPGADGMLTYGALFRVQPFQNDLIVLTLTGKQLKAVLEQQFAAAMNDRSRLLGVSSGFSYRWDAARAQGDRVIAESMTLNGSAIRADLEYRVTANSFIAGGSEGFSTFREGRDRQVAVVDLEALVQFLSANSPYSPPPVGRRIKRLN
jgi:5'-nucleotidase